MWKQLKIAEQTYFIFCSFNDNTEEITFTLYDLNVTWSQTNNFKDVKQKVKLLNKRFDFNEDNIKEALTSDAIQSAVLEVNNLNSCLLKLKYGVKNCLMSYEWSLKKQNLLEFQQTFVQPLLLTLLGCHEQIEILTDSVRKKDIELKQFRIEGAILNRKTLVTKPFDFEDFNKKFENCNKLTKNFKELAKYVQEAKSPVETEILSNTNEKRTQKVIKPEHDSIEDQRSNKKINPRQLKRKAHEVKMERLQQHLKLRRQGLEYESSQSQTPSSGSSQTVEEFERKDLRKGKQTATKGNEKSKSESPLSLRKSSRCSTMKQKQYNFSTDDNTDSEESSSRTPTQKISPRSFASTINSVKTNSNNQDTKPSSKTHSQEKPEKKKLNNSYNFETKVSTNCKESSRVFDFSSENEDDMPLLQRKTSQKNIKQQDSEEFNSENVKLNTSILSPISIKSPSFSNSLNISSTPPIINEISSQLDNIKKELETLEAMRLADLKQRT